MGAEHDTYKGWRNGGKLDLQATTFPRWPALWKAFL